MPTFVLEQFHWRRAGPTGWVRLPGETAVATFADAADAHAECARREAAVRAVVGHPCRCGTSLAELTTLPDFAFQDWLRDADPDPYWWEQNHRTLHPRQVKAVWEVFDRVRLYEVLALPTEVSG